jgi:hypothetical protein
MTDAAIARVEALAHHENQPLIQASGLVVEWHPDQPIDDDEYDRDFPDAAPVTDDVFDPADDDVPDPTGTCRPCRRLCSTTTPPHGSGPRSARKYSTKPTNNGILKNESEHFANHNENEEEEAEDHNENEEEEAEHFANHINEDEHSAAERRN